MDIPAKISDDVVSVMRQNAETAFRAIGGLGLSRCDFFYTDKGEIFLNELNTMPYFYPVVYVSTTLGQYGNQLSRLNRTIGWSCQGKF